MIRIATKQAAHSTYIYRLGAVITKGHRVLSTGYNQLAYCSLNNFKNSKHAEMAAILKVLRKPNGLSSLAGATMYISRITATGKTAMSKPCKKCMKLIHSVGIKEIIYTTDNGTTKEKVL